MQEFASLILVEQAESVVLFGPSGVGKIHLTIALGYLATQRSCKLLFTSATDLMPPKTAQR